MAAENLEPSEVIRPAELAPRHLAAVPYIGAEALGGATETPSTRPAPELRVTPAAQVHVNYIDRYKPASPTR